MTRDLAVWRRGIELVLATYEATVNLPREERYGLCSQIRRAAISIPTNLAEGCGRSSDAGFAQFVHYAIGSANELETLLVLAERLDFLSAVRANKIQALLDDLQPMLRTLLARCRR